MFGGIPPLTPGAVGEDNGKYLERERIKRLIRSMIREASDPAQDYPAGRCCINRMTDILEAVSDPAREG